MQNAGEEVTIQTPRGDIAGLQFGSSRSASRRILALHGFLDNANSFLPLASHLNMPDTCLIAIDTPGTGKSFHYPEHHWYSLFDYMVDMQNALKSLDWHTCYLLGHSKGAGLCLMFAALHPERVEGVVLLDSFGPIPRQPSGVLPAWRRVLDKISENHAAHSKVYTRASARERLMHAVPGLSARSAELMVERGTADIHTGRLPTGAPERSQLQFTRDPKLKMYYMKTQVCFTPEHLIAAWQSVLENVPSLVIMSSETMELVKSRPYAELIHTLRLQAGVSQATTVARRVDVKVAEGSHHVHMNHPERVTPLIEEFLIGVDSKLPMVSKL